MCKVTILDEDFPGTLGFDKTEISVQKGQDHVDIVVSRSDGSDGTIQCVVKTEQLSDVKTSNTANEFEDYVPTIETVVFQHQTNEMVVAIQLVNIDIPNIDKIGANKVDEEEEKAED